MVFSASASASVVAITRCNTSSERTVDCCVIGVLSPILSPTFGSVDYSHGVLVIFLHHHQVMFIFNLLGVSNPIADAMLRFTIDFDEFCHTGSSAIFEQLG